MRVGGYLQLFSELMCAEPADPLSASILPIVERTTAFSTLLVPTCNTEESRLEDFGSHSDAVIRDTNDAVSPDQPFPSKDDLRRVSVIGIFYKLDKRGAVSTDQKFTQLPE
jgi:hypothetical protein